MALLTVCRDFHRGKAGLSSDESLVLPYVKQDIPQNKSGCIKMRLLIPPTFDTSAFFFYSLEGVLVKSVEYGREIALASIWQQHDCLLSFVLWPLGHF